MVIGGRMNVVTVPKILTHGPVHEGNACDLATFIGQCADAHMLIEDRILEAVCIHPEWFSHRLTLERPSVGHGSTTHCVGESLECESVGWQAVCFTNNLLRLNTGGRTLIWRIQKYDIYNCRTWSMSWPD
jgi:hypothetical protein